MKAIKTIIIILFVIVLYLLPLFSVPFYSTLPDWAKAISFLILTINSLSTSSFICGAFSKWFDSKLK